MPSMLERLRVLDEMGAPDLWSDIRQRQPGLRSGHGASPPGHRLVAAILALVVAIAGSLVVVRAFSGEETSRPLTVSGAERIVFGSTAEGVVRKAGTSVFVVRGDAG